MSWRKHKTTTKLRVHISWRINNLIRKTVLNIGQVTDKNDR